MYRSGQQNILHELQYRYFLNGHKPAQHGQLCIKIMITGSGLTCQLIWIQIGALTLRMADLSWHHSDCCVPLTASEADKTNYAQKLHKMWYRQQIWHGCSLESSKQFYLIGHLKIQDDGKTLVSPADWSFGLWLETHGRSVGLFTYLPLNVLVQCSRAGQQQPFWWLFLEQPL